MITLRPYQDRICKKIQEFFTQPQYKGTKQIVVSPVGSGKSILIAEAAKCATKIGGVLILQPNLELLRQNYHRFTMYGGQATIYSSSAGEKVVSDVIYATLGSVKSMGKELKKLGIKTVIVDECHYGYPPHKWEIDAKTKKRKVKHSMFSQLLKDLAPDRVLGFTATPFTLKSTAMGQDTMLHIMTRVKPSVFTDFLHIEPISTMVKGNYWADIRYKCFDFDEGLLRYNASGTDFTEESIEQANLKLNVNNNTYLEVTRILREDPRNKVLLFAESVKVANRFQEVIPGSRVVDSDTTGADRQTYIDEFARGDSRVLINYGIFQAGFDSPSLTHVVLARPIGSYTVVYQMVGRGVRLHPEGLPYQLVDLCGNINRFGRLEDLELQNLAHDGWVATTICRGESSKRVLLTGVPVGSKYSVEEVQGIKSEVRYYQPTMMIPKGKFRGRLISKAPVWYLRWCLKDEGLAYFASEPDHQKLIEQITKYLNYKTQLR